MYNLLPGVSPFRPFFVALRRPRNPGASWPVEGSDLAAPAQPRPEFSSFSFTFSNSVPLTALNEGLILPQNRAGDGGDFWV